MRELVGVSFLMFLQVTSLLFSAIGSAWSSAGSIVHVFFVRCATRHDIKFALTPEEMAVCGRMQKSGGTPPSGPVESSKWGAN